MAMYSKTLVKTPSATHGRHSALHWPQSRQPPVRCATVNRSQRSCSTSRPHALQAYRNHPDAVIIDIDAVAQGLEVISTAWAFSAAEATAGDIAGSPAVYTRYMQQLLPVLRQPYEAGLMLRLLHEEGVVGARSTAGREGPVVGRPVRHSGSRPLLLNEILEHWVDEILPTCLLRWSRQAGCSSSELEHRVREAYQQAQQTIHWEVVDVQQRQHGSSYSKQRTAVSAAAATAGTAVSRGTGTINSSSSSSSTISSSPAAFSTASVQCLAATATTFAEGNTNSRSSTQTLQPAVTLTVQPFVSVVPCLQNFPAQVYLASTYPPRLTEAALAAAGLQGWDTAGAPLGGSSLQEGQPRPVKVLYGSCIEQCLQQVVQPGSTVQQQQQQQMPHSSLRDAADQPSQSPGRSSSSTTSSSSSSRCKPKVLVVLSSPSKLTEPHLWQQQQQQLQQQQQQQHAQPDQALPQTQRFQVLHPIQVAEWACKAPSLRARALSGQGLGLLSEWGLAEMLGVDSSDAVMDGIAWR